MFRNLAATIAAAAILVTTQAASAVPVGGMNALSSTKTENTNIVQIHSKRCKFVDAQGRKYKDHCPHGVKKGSRKKRTAIGAGVGAGIGAIIGGIAGGGRGAAIGAAAGAGAGALSGAASAGKKCWYRDRNGRRYKARCRQ